MERRQFIALATTTVAAASGTDAFAQPSAPASMHPPKYKALEDAAAACVVSADDCLPHCLGMLTGKDTSMAACTRLVIEVSTVCRALQTLASVNSTFTVAFREGRGRCVRRLRQGVPEVLREIHRVQGVRGRLQEVRGRVPEGGVIAAPSM
jgi:Cys-rich four helix bundle protein (predicted Tat secretion target)